MAQEPNLHGTTRAGSAWQPGNEPARGGHRGGIDLIVAGYDGSDEAAAALQWAAELAHRNSSRLRVVWAWEMTDMWGEAVAAHHDLHAPPLTELEELAHLRLAALVAELVGELVSDVDIQPARDIDAATALLGAAADADILVIGSRGRGRVRTAVTGSVSGRCIREATCPVLVIPHRMATVSEGPVDPRTVQGEALAR